MPTATRRVSADIRALTKRLTTDITFANKVYGRAMNRDDFDTANSADKVVTKLTTLKKSLNRRFAIKKS